MKMKMKTKSKAIRELLIGTWTRFKMCLYTRPTNCHSIQNENENENEKEIYSYTRPTIWTLKENEKVSPMLLKVEKNDGPMTISFLPRDNFSYFVEPTYDFRNSLGFSCTPSGTLGSYYSWYFLVLSPSLLFSWVPDLIKIENQKQIFERKLKYGDVLQKSSHDRNVCTLFFI